MNKEQSYDPNLPFYFYWTKKLEGELLIQDALGFVAPPKSDDKPSCLLLIWVQSSNTFDNSLSRLLHCVMSL